MRGIGIDQPQIGVVPRQPAKRASACAACREAAKANSTAVAILALFRGSC